MTTSRPDRSRTTTHRLLAASGLVLSLLVSGLLAVAGSSPAQARIARFDDQVSYLSFVGATEHSLTLQWPGVPDATSYEVEEASSLAMGDRHLVSTPTGTTTTIDGLDAGRTYCFQIRALRGEAIGRRSARACKPTILAQGSDTGAIYQVTTYNMCTYVCDNWHGRRPGALALIQSSDADVVALQETSEDAGVISRLKPRYALAVQGRKKVLLYDKARFVSKRQGLLFLGKVPGTNNMRWAVWAELADRLNDGKRVIFTSAHAAGVPDTLFGAKVRRQNTRLLIRGVARANRNHVPVIYAGDFNSHKYDRYDESATLFHAHGYYDAFDLAENLIRPNFNTANGFELVPRISHTYGAHVDHVWVDPDTSRVLSWESVAELSGSNYAAPLPSNHNPLTVRVQVN